ncbi:PAS/PAC sensor signal transduction histidine kinase [Desulfarculus baarsii DSM 2075]|uniref:histidine kinase n=1 Tax=Desulfarculus baarsii (strain ATCC 33931 / DSM 2075 / LMG 7858 / VKM B-1802 / 2st14) TaxID=644282 RepID=E1QDT9_DESB2|nr:PAS domain S-box protein [Desulfarculus baarsii]ADK83725.1 PAS/PAC sensor signal transduction histidine kinase [Desulfarculus baarsii DSM 2075]
MEDRPQVIDECVAQLREVVQELEKFRQIVDTAQDAVVTVNQSQEVVFMNRAAEKMFGYAREELLGRDMAPLIPAQFRRSHHSYIERLARTGRQKTMGHPMQLQAERRDGGVLPIHLTFSVAEVDGQYLFTAIMRDLSEKQGLTEKIKRSETLAVVGQMVATVGHEIRQPLTSIGGFARQLTKETGISEPGKRKLQIIIDEVARLEHMLNELNDLSRPTEYRWQEASLADILGGVLASLAPDLAGAHIQLVIDDNLPPVLADPDRIGQVLRNIIINAIQASGPEPRLEIGLDQSSDGGARLRVRDHGAGLGVNAAGQVFKPFYTTKKGGTGLGLPVARRIVGDHDGKLTLAPAQGGGAVATLKLPPAHGRRPGQAGPDEA